jgi:hypothetical protein
MMWAILINEYKQSLTSFVITLYTVLDYNTGIVDSNPPRSMDVRGCIQKFPDWLPGAKTVNGTALCH